MFVVRGEAIGFCYETAQARDVLFTLDMKGTTQSLHD